ncbi:nuclear transport factor 2 [Strigomonas culicis]|nr:nuclear transport factor 2 [Strigomonas culicis]|eukprot:EPY31734.1 nuclear transport factor 2 [Strigomonas culicis]
MLAGVYRPTSLLTWQNEQIQGAESIMARFEQLQFNESVFKKDSVDCQPLGTGVLVVVNGEVALQGERYALKFNDVFHLANEGQSWYIANQIFNIVGGGTQMSE